jgi:hypothetical protein
MKYSGIKSEDYDWFHIVIIIQEMCRCGSAGVPGFFAGGKN